MGHATLSQCPRMIRDFLANSPGEVQSGVAHVHQYRIKSDDPGIVVSVMVPSATGFPNAKMADLAMQDLKHPWPQKFVLSDGYSGGDFLYVDLSPKSPLKIEMKRVLNRMKKDGFDPAVDREAFLNHVASDTSQYFNSSEAASLTKAADGIISDPPAFNMGTAASQTFSDFKGKGIGSMVFDLGEKKGLVPFEYYFTDNACGMCIHKALLASLILDEAGIPHRFRTGFASFTGPSYSNTGHSFLELEDGRILDPTWHFLKPKVMHPQNSDWIEGAG